VAVAAQALLDGVDGCRHARIVCWQGANERKQQQSGVEVFIAVAIDEMAACVVPGVLHDLVMDVPPQRAQAAVGWSVGTAAFS
jgi:hypothetical protein